MEEQLISLEVAELAKEKKYIIPSYYFYENNKVYTYESFMDWNELSEEDNKNDRLNAPTQSLLQKWLREKHNLLVFVFIQFENKTIYDLNDESEEFFEYIFYIKNIEKMRNERKNVLPYINIGCEDFFNNNYKTYEEALEEGLKQALNLI